MNQTIKTNTAIAAIGALIVTILIFALFIDLPTRSVGASVAVGNQYQSTTTPQATAGTNLCPVRSGSVASTGVLGSVNVLKSGAGNLAFYDATTTDVTKRTGNLATSSIILADFNGAPTVGSYHFDIEFKRGLIVEHTNTGTGVASTTVGYRCEG